MTMEAVIIVTSGPKKNLFVRLFLLALVLLRAFGYCMIADAFLRRLFQRRLSFRTACYSHAAPDRNHFGRLLF